jgi:hypothetical protein
MGRRALLLVAVVLAFPLVVVGMLAAMVPGTVLEVVRQTWGAARAILRGPPAPRPNRRTPADVSVKARPPSVSDKRARTVGPSVPVVTFGPRGRLH